MNPNSDEIPAIGDDALRLRVAELAAECARLRLENVELRRRFGVEATTAPTHTVVPDPTPTHFSGTLTNASPAEAKLSFFRRLFRGREDVFAVRWIGKDGKAGYSPAALKDWS